MTIHLKPEVEALVQKDVQRGSYGSADEFVERAIEMLHEQEQWLEEHRKEIHADIEAGYASAIRGDLVDPEEMKSRMEERKAEWRARQGR